MKSMQSNQEKVDLFVICPHFPPDPGGLSDYCYYFIKTFQSQFPDKNIVLLTRSTPHGQTVPIDGVSILPLMTTWGLAALIPLTKLLLKYRPQKILIQYVPYMYGRAGVNLFFPFWALCARLLFRRHIDLVAHELFYPFEFSIRGQILFWTHFCMFQLICFSSRNIFCSTDYFIKLVWRITLGIRTPKLLRVGPNIMRKTSPLMKERKNLVLFGSAHASKNYAMVLQALDSYFQAEPDIYHLDIVGQTIGQLQQLLVQGHINLSENFWKSTTCHGPLAEGEVGKIFAQSHLSINYFIDGVSSRRSTVISALNSGLPVVTTWHKNSEKIFLNQPFLFLLSCNPEEFSKELVHFLATYKHTPNHDVDALKKQAMLYVDHYFSWENIVKEFWQAR